MTDSLGNPAARAFVRPLPDKPNLEQQRKLAKALARDYWREAPEAVARVQALHPNPPARPEFALSDAQLVIARGYGFASWAKLKHKIEPHTPVGQHLLQRLGLRHVPGEPVEQEPRPGVVLSQPALDHGNRDLVRYQVAAVHEGLGLAAKFGAGAHVVTEDVACRNFRYRQVGGNELGLCPLARAGWPYEDDSHYLRKPS